MNYFNSLSEAADTTSGGALTIGNFDGIHLAHARLIKEAILMSTKLKKRSSILTFFPHTGDLLKKNFFHLNLPATIKKNI